MWSDPWPGCLRRPCACAPSRRRAFALTQRERTIPPVQVHMQAVSESPTSCCQRQLVLSLAAVQNTRINQLRLISNRLAEEGGCGADLGHDGDQGGLSDVAALAPAQLLHIFRLIILLHMHMSSRAGTASSIDHIFKPFNVAAENAVKSLCNTVNRRQGNHTPCLGL